ncbi:AI-2E family transporter [Larkinella insperata]|uniref:AI-2E family transporter n=1 Tax=Larkinella insperata TaxID=332158 RepID=A0ABW3Q726_9BACT|nr:AI-2E family transporter [Larkinella insperata]
MENKQAEVNLPSYVRLACILIVTTILVYWLSTMQEFLVPLVFSVLFAMILYPIDNRLERWGVPRVPAILVCLVIVIGFLYLLFYLVSLQIANFTQEAPKLVERGNAILDRLQTFGEDRFHIKRSEITKEAKNYFNNLIRESGSFLTSTLLATTNTLSTISIVPLYIFFLMLYRDFFRTFFYKVFNTTKRAKIDVVFGRIYTVVKDYLVGLVLVIVIVGVLNTVGLLILGIDYAVFFGFLGAFMILIPYIGILIGSLLPALFTLLTNDNPLIALGVIGVFSFVQILEGNFITPYIVGSKVSINPLSAIVVLLLWGQLWGVTGLILALPMTAILKVIFDAVEPLKPYGFLLGEAERQKTRPLNVKDIADKIPKKVKDLVD